MKNKSLIFTLAIIGSFVFCLPAAFKISQGSRNVAPDVQGWLTDGSCTHEGNQVHCDFTDAPTAKKWAESMEDEASYWKEQAGRPTSILMKVCRDHGYEDADCPRILYGMAQQESYFGKVMDGDSGRSHGFFHIMYYHNVPRSCTDDLKCSANWTLDRMVRLGFATNRNIAIERHNGTPGIPATIHYLAEVKSKMSLFDKAL